MNISEIRVSTRDGDEVRFHGELLASVSSHAPVGTRATRWREISLYRQTDGAYVIHSVGRTLVAGESDRYTVDIVDSAEAVMEALVPGGQKPRFMVADLLYAAEEKDAAFLPLLDRLEVEDLVLSDDKGTALPSAGEPYVLVRDGDRSLRFRGVLIANQSSRKAKATLWNEIKIYRVAAAAPGAKEDTTRYVVWKAGCATDKPSRAVVTIVPTGLAALRALIRREKSWLELTAYDALASAADRDPYFNRTLYDMLNNARYRQLFSEVPELSRAERKVLTRLQAGSALVTRQDDHDRSLTQRVLGWHDDPHLPAPGWQVFLGLSRQRLIYRAHGAVVRHDPKLGVWEITNLGRQALDAKQDG